MTEISRKLMERHINSHIVIRNGRVLDPANGFDGIADVEIQNGKIVKVEKDLDIELKQHEEFDATGCLVTPGLIDIHAHVYQYATPLGVNPDETCLARGVTTVVDAGSAGASTLPGLQKYVVENSKTRVLCFVHVASHGLSAAGCAGVVKGGECDSLNQVDPESCAKCIQENRDVAVGVKLRLSCSVTNDGEYEEEAYRRALRASSVAGVPLMVHFTHSSITVNESQGKQFYGFIGLKLVYHTLKMYIIFLDTDQLTCPGSLRKGDILTHVFHAHQSSIVNPSTQKIHPSIHQARKRGVLFDIGHGFGSFSWTVAEICAKEQFWPDIISTDLHTMSLDGPAYDLPMVMSKLLNIGMPLVDIIRAVTITPASAIGWQDNIGSLSPGLVADVTVLKVEDIDMVIEDSQGQVRAAKKLLNPVAVWRGGERFVVRKPDPVPGKNTARLIEDWDGLIIKDNTKPTPLE